jgi:hypothetical protein
MSLSRSMLRPLRSNALRNASIAALARRANTTNAPARDPMTGEFTTQLPDIEVRFLLLARGRLTEVSVVAAPPGHREARCAKSHPSVEEPCVRSHIRAFVFGAHMLPLNMGTADGSHVDDPLEHRGRLARAQNLAMFVRPRRTKRQH